MVNCYLSSDLKSGWVLGSIPVSVTFVQSPADSARQVQWIPADSVRQVQQIPADSVRQVQRIPADSIGQVQWIPVDSVRQVQRIPADSGNQCVTRCHISRIRWNPPESTGIWRNPADHVGECKVLSLPYFAYFAYSK